jgi:hypothetical protein
MKISLDIGQRDSGHLVVSSAARRPDTELAINRRMRWNEAMGKPRKWGVCEAALQPRQAGKAHGRQAKVPNRTWEIRPYGIIGGPPETQPWWK